MTSPAGADTCVDATAILVCKMQMSAVHEEVTGMAFHGHNNSEHMLIFVSISTVVAGAQVFS